MFCSAAEWISAERETSEMGGITWNEDRKALTRIGVEFNYGEVGNELWLTVELVWWFDLIVRGRWSGCTALRMEERVAAEESISGVVIWRHPFSVR